MRAASDREPLRVAYVITGLMHGGAEHQLLILTAGLRARGCEVLVVSLIPPGALASDFEDLGAMVESLHLGRGSFDPRAPLRLAGLLRRFRPDIVHSHLVHGNLLARLAALFYPVPVLISTVHSVQEGGWWRKIGIRVTDRLCDLTTVVSQAVGDRYLAQRLAPRSKLRVVPNGVDTERFRVDLLARDRMRAKLGLEGCFTWLAVGRFADAKDYPTLFRALCRLAERGCDARLLLVGEGPLRTEHEEMVSRLGIAESVSFLGERGDISDLLNAADGYVMSSAWEGLPMVLLEASASELPIVATDVGGNREIVTHGETGFLVRPNDPVALAAEMERLAATPAPERSRFGIQGRRRVEENFAQTRVLDQWVDLYLQLLARRTRVA